MVIKEKTFLMFIISSFVILTISTNFKKIYTLIYAHNPEINYGDLKSGECLFCIFCISLVWPFKRNLFGSTFPWYDLFVNVLQNEKLTFCWLLTLIILFVVNGVTGVQRQGGNYILIITRQLVWQHGSPLCSSVHKQQVQNSQVQVRVHLVTVKINNT